MTSIRHRNLISLVRNTNCKDLYPGFLSYPCGIILFIKDCEMNRETLMYKYVDKDFLQD
jgi:hypothetical protein